MALVNVQNMIVLDNPSSFSNDFQFEIEFECLGELEDDLEWKVTYVGSADDSTKDQVLEEVMVGPVPQGVSKFVLTAEAPDSTLIPVRDLVGITVVLVTCAYREKEFVRIGYYVNNEYYHTSPLVAPPPAAPVVVMGPDGIQVQQVPEPPAPPEPVIGDELEALIEANGALDVRNVYRNIMSDKPRVTRFQIDWTPQALLLEQQRAAEAQAQAHQEQQAAFLQHQQLQQQQQQQQQFGGELVQAPGYASGGLPAPPLHGSGSSMMGLGEFAQQQQAMLHAQQQQQQQYTPGGLGFGGGAGALGY